MPSNHRRPMNVYVRRGSAAERFHRGRAGLPGSETLAPEALAPGFHPTPAHNLIFHHGKIIRDLTFTNLYIGGSKAWDPSDRQNIDTKLAAAMSDRNLNNVMVQYFENQSITSTFGPSRILPGTPPQEFSQGDVEALVQSLFTQGELEGFDFGGTVFNFLLPRGAILTTDAAPAGGQRKPRRTASKHPTAVPVEDEDSSTDGLGGYHGSVHAGPGGGTTLYYAIGVFSENLPDGTMNGIAVFDQPWKNVVATFYHELNEARTDPDVEDAIRAGNDPSATGFLGWVSREGEEVGDFPVFEAKPLTKVFQEVPLTGGAGTAPIQFQYSNAVRGPEGPIANPHPLPQHAFA